MSDDRTVIKRNVFDAKSFAVSATHVSHHVGRIAARQTVIKRRPRHRLGAAAAAPFTDEHTKASRIQRAKLDCGTKSQD